MLRALVAFVLFAVLVLGGVLVYHGFFTTPRVAEKEMGPYTVAVKRVAGPYYKVGPTMMEVDAYLRELGLEPTKGIGLFYDDPATVAESDLRSDMGDVLEGVDEEALAKIKEKYEVKDIPAVRSAVVTFPIKSMLSYMIGPMKVYPALSAYWKEKGYATDTEGYSMELYDVPGKTIYYIMPIVQ